MLRCLLHLCKWRLLSEEKVDVGQREHLKGRSGAFLELTLPSPLPSCFLIWCRSQFDLVVNQSGQARHLYGFWPVWVRMCRLRLLSQGNLRAQKGQAILCGAEE